MTVCNWVIRDPRSVLRRNRRFSRFERVRQTRCLQTGIVLQTERPIGRLLFENDGTDCQRLIRPLMRVLTRGALDGGADRRSSPQPKKGRRRPEVGRLRLAAAENRRLTGDCAREAIAREGQGPSTRWLLETRRLSGFGPWPSRPPFVGPLARPAPRPAVGRVLARLLRRSPCRPGTGPRPHKVQDR